MTEAADTAYAVPIDVDGDGCVWQLFPKDEPLELGGRRVASVALEPTDLAVW